MTILKNNSLNKVALTILLNILLCLPTSIMAEKVDLSGRTEKDLKRDMTSKPAEIIEFSGIKKGDKVLDFLGGAGYYTELLKRAVGNEGSVVLHNNQATMDFVAQYMIQQEAKGYLANITKLQSEPGDLKLGENQFDSIFLVLSFHDFFYKEKGWLFDAEPTIETLSKALKANGKLLIIDHNNAVGHGIKDVKELHRIEDTFAKAELEKRGFRMIKSSDILRNEKDDYSISVFEPKVRRNTDRFVMLFEKTQ